MRIKAALLIGLFILVGFVAIITYQNNRINALSKYINETSEKITQLNSTIDYINTNIELQKKDIDNVLTSSSKLKDDNTQDLIYWLTDNERRINQLENTVVTLPDVQLKKAYIKHIRKEYNQIIVAFDFVECFIGEDATKASKEDGLNEIFESTGLYIRNKDFTEELIPVTEDFIVYVLEGSNLYGTCISELLSDKALTYGNDNYRLFDVLIVGNRVTAIEEIYIA